MCNMRESHLLPDINFLLFVFVAGRSVRLLYSLKERLSVYTISKSFDKFCCVLLYEMQKRRPKQAAATVSSKTIGKFFCLFTIISHRRRPISDKMVPSNQTNQTFALFALCDASVCVCVCHKINAEKSMSDDTVANLSMPLNLPNEPQKFI